MKTEQLERGWSAHKRNKSKSGRWYLKRWTNRLRRRELRRWLEDAPKRFTQGWEF